MKKFFEQGNFEAAIVRGGRLLQEAKRLRHRCFFNSEGIDSDKYDRSCYHIVVIDKKNKAVVGTYRLLLGAQASRCQGFYTQSRFNLSNLTDHCAGEILEMSRACIDINYRRSRVLPILWKAIFSFIEDYQVRCIIGVTGVEGSTTKDVAGIMSYFKKHCWAPLAWRVKPRRGYIYKYPRLSKRSADGVTLRTLPALIQGYLKMGAWVCGEPAVRDASGDPLFFMLADTASLNTAYKKQFLKKS